MRRGCVSVVQHLLLMQMLNSWHLQLKRQRVGDVKDLYLRPWKAAASQTRQYGRPTVLPNRPIYVTLTMCTMYR